MRSNETEPGLKRASGNNLHIQAYNVHRPRVEEKSESYTNNVDDSSDYTYADENSLSEEIMNNDRYMGDDRRTYEGRAPNHNRMKNENQSSSLVNPQGKRKASSRSGRDQNVQYIEPVQYRQFESGAQMIKKHKTKQNTQADYRHQSPQESKHVGRKASADRGDYVMSATAPKNKDKRVRKHRITKHEADQLNEMQPLSLNESLGEIVYKERDMRFRQPNRYPRARADETEYAAILEDYSELYRVRITAPEEQVTVLMNELNTIKSQLIDVQCQIDGVFASVINYIEDGKHNVQQLVSNVEGLNNSINTFCKSIDTRLREANEQISSNNILVKASMTNEQQSKDDNFFKMLDSHLKTSISSYLPAYIQANQKNQVQEDKLNNQGASIRQLRAPLPLVDSSSIAEKYKVLELKYVKALVTIKAMRLSAGLVCVPINTDADYLEFINELEAKVGAIDKDFMKGKYMLSIKGTEDEQNAYTGYLDVVTDNEILLRHKNLPSWLTEGASEQLKKNMVMSAKDLPYVSHEIYETLLPSQDLEGEQT